MLEHAKFIMNPLDPGSLKFWETFGELGFILVVIGVVGEGIEILPKLLKPELYERNKRTLEKIGLSFWIILILGLAAEFLGNHKAMRIANSINAKLNEEAANARKEAAEANERTAAIQLRIQPRTITKAQSDEFIKLCEGLARTPIKVMMGMHDAETLNYGRQVRAMLDAAGFGSDAGQQRDGIVIDDNAFIKRPQGSTMDYGSLVFIKNDTNVVVQENGRITIPNGRGFYYTNYDGNQLYWIPGTNDSLATARVFDVIFARIGITSTWLGRDNAPFLHVGEAAIFVPEKWQ
jgi:hypothetical protein